MGKKSEYDLSERSMVMNREYDIQIRMVPMRSGVCLHTMVFLPSGCTLPCGTLLIRNPYYSPDFIPLIPDIASGNGLVCVMQSCRGCGLSEGTFTPSDTSIEEEDGADTVDWIIRQPWSNGKVSLFGASYCGWTQWNAAFSGSDAIRAMVPDVAPLSSCSSVMAPGRGGVNNHGFSISWNLAMFHRRNCRESAEPNYEDKGILNTLPVCESDVAAGYGKVPAFREFMKTAGEWGPDMESIAGKFRNIKAPAFITGGWFDGFKAETFASFKFMKECSATRASRNFTRLMIGPWGHGGLLNHDLFGDEAGTEERNRLRDEFMVSALKQADGRDPLPEQPIVKYFMMGENRWYSDNTWPPPHCDRYFYLREDGLLSEEMTGHESQGSSYTYDPADPTPSFRGKRSTPGCYDRSDEEKRSDIICFTTPVLKKALKVAGNIRVRLFVSSSAPDTDFFATLTDVYPDGRSMYLTTGSVRIRFCVPHRNDAFLEPGEVRELLVDLSECANTFLPGHAVRVEIHSAFFPNCGRNMNTVDPINTGTAMEKAFQHIWHDKNRPSSLILPEISE